jgi:hypothetical protein
MAKRVKAGNFYRVSGMGLFEIIGGVLRDGEIVQVVNPPGGRNSGYLRHVMNEQGEVTFCNIHFLEPI